MGGNDFYIDDNGEASFRLATKEEQFKSVVLTIVNTLENEYKYNNTFGIRYDDILNTKKPNYNLIYTNFNDQFKQFLPDFKNITNWQVIENQTTKTAIFTFQVNSLNGIVVNATSEF